MRGKCKNCNNLKNEWCEKVADSPHPDIERDCQYFCQKTNADVINSMTVEEKAELLSQLAYAGKTPWAGPFARKFCDSCPTVTCTVEGYHAPMEFNECDFVDGKCPHGTDIVWWLNQPAEEGKLWEESNPGS